MATVKQLNGIFLSFLLGGVVGGIIALLNAPKSGRHLRNDISRKANKLIEESKKKTYDTWNGVKEKTESILDSANDALNAGINRIVSDSDNVKEAFKSGLDA